LLHVRSIENAALNYIGCRISLGELREFEKPIASGKL